MPHLWHGLANGKFYNNYGKFWYSDDKDIDITTYEGYVMNTLVEKYQAKTSFINAKYKWGSIDKTTGLWNGGVGNVGFI